MFDVQELLNRVSTFEGSLPSMEQLGNWVFSQNWEAFQWESCLPDASDTESYSRNILAVSPMEVALLRWSPGAMSAVHLHEGFWGFVVCLSGQLEHHGYQRTGDELMQVDRVVAFTDGVLAEPDGTIHRLVNGSAEVPLVTLHFYVPALSDLGGLQLFDLDKGDVLTCASSAPAAVLDLPRMHYERIQQRAFTFLPNPSLSSHDITPVVPKPDPETIQRLLTEYYRAQASDYDRLDQTDARRHAYTKGINGFIAECLRKLHSRSPLRSLLDVGCGTGRRAIDIRELTGLEYRVFGSDLSPEMSALASSRGLHMRPGFWEGESGLSELDAVTFLYAYGHLSTRLERISALKRLRAALRPGGMLFVDVFNRDDPHEWGPQLLADFNAWHLGAQGYEVGDVFYSRKGSSEMAFLHYTNEQEMTSMLEEAGFCQIQCARIGYAHQPGQEVEEGGSLMFHAINPFR